MAVDMGMMYTLLKLDGNVAVLRCIATNAVLRFLPNDDSLACVAVGSQICLDALRWDGATKAIVCRACEPAIAFKRPRQL